MYAREVYKSPLVTSSFLYTVSIVYCTKVQKYNHFFALSATEAIHTSPCPTGISKRPRRKKRGGCKPNISFKAGPSFSIPRPSRVYRSRTGTCRDKQRTFDYRAFIPAIKPTLAINQVASKCVDRSCQVILNHSCRVFPVTF